MRLVISLNYYVYQHRRLDTGEVFYVGKGCDQRAWSVEGRNHLWRKMAADCGRSVEILRVGLSEREALKMEASLITELRASGVQLANMQGGRIVATKAAKAKIKRRYNPPAAIYNGEKYYRWRKMHGHQVELATMKGAVDVLRIPASEAKAIIEGYKNVSNNGWCIYKPRGPRNEH